MAKKAETPKDKKGVIKYFTLQGKGKDKDDKPIKVGKLSDGFSDTKNGKVAKNNKAGKTDDIEFEDGTVLLVDESVEVKSITGKVKFFAIRGASLKVNGKKLI